MGTTSLAIHAIPPAIGDAAAPLARVAKSLLASWKQDERRALMRVNAVYRDPGPPSLQRAQHIVAVEAGFPDWAAAKDPLEPRVRLQRWLSARAGMGFDAHRESILELLLAVGHPDLRTMGMDHIVGRLHGLSADHASAQALQDPCLGIITGRTTSGYAVRHAWRCQRRSRVILMTGTTGSGKSTAARRIIRDMSDSVPIIVWDMLGDGREPLVVSPDPDVSFPGITMLGKGFDWSAQRVHPDVLAAWKPHTWRSGVTHHLISGHHTTTSAAFNPISRLGSLAKHALLIIDHACCSAAAMEQTVRAIRVARHHNQAIIVVGQILPAESPAVYELATDILSFRWPHLGAQQGDLPRGTARVLKRDGLAVDVGDIVAFQEA